MKLFALGLITFVASARYIPDAMNDNGFQREPLQQVQLPTNFTWANVDGTNYLTNIRN